MPRNKFVDFFSLFVRDNIETDKSRRKRKMPKRGRAREKRRERGINSHISADFNGAGNEPQPAVAAAAVHFNELLPFKYNFIMARQTNGSRAGQQRQTALPAVELPSKKKGFSGFIKLILMCSLIRIFKIHRKPKKTQRNCKK